MYPYDEYADRCGDIEPLGDILSDARDVQTVIDQTFAATELRDQSTRIAFAFALLRISHKHFQGILTLASNRNYICTFALVRPLAESSFRGLWLCTEAGKGVSDEVFREEKPIRYPPFRQMNKEVTTIVFQHPALTHFQEFWDKMCDFTHAGPLLVQHYLMGLFKPDKQNLAMGGVLVLLSGFLLASAHAFSLLTNNWEVTRALHPALDAFEQKLPAHRRTLGRLGEFSKVMDWNEEMKDMLGSFDDLH